MSASEGRLTLVGGTAREGLAARVAQAITRASQYLFRTQHARGYWHAPLEANATMEAEYVFFNRLLGRERPDVERRLAERLLAHRPSVRLPAEAAVAELWLRAPTRDDLAFARSPELVTTRNFFLAVDRALKTLAPLSWRGLRRRAVARAIEWLLRHQDTNGQWGGIQPAMVNSVLALHAVGFAADHPAMMSGIQGVEDFLVECEGTLMYQPCVSPNWDTALAARALLDAGLDPAHPALGRAAE